MFSASVSLVPDVESYKALNTEPNTVLKGYHIA